jgi:hypothetical protein
MSMFVLCVNDHGACPNPICMSISMSMPLVRVCVCASARERVCASGCARACV